MQLTGIPIEVEMREASPPGDVTEMELRHYTLGGTHNTQELAVSTMHAMEYLCDL